MMSDEEKKDILFQIDMQLYDEFNDKFCEMNDNLGTIYTYKDIDDLEKLEKETEIKLLRKAIEKQQKTIDEMTGYLTIIRDCPNENCGANLDCENRCNNDDDLVKECWKMYFERKIEKE